MDKEALNSGLDLRDKLSESSLAWERYWRAVYRAVDRSKPWTCRPDPVWHEPRRARRIRQRLNAKAHARWVAKHIWNQEPDEQKMAERLADHLAHCSKMCCNKRRFWEGPTIQEKRHDRYR